jgi:hypothetical protein
MDVYRQGAVEIIILVNAARAVSVPFWKLDMMLSCISHAPCHPASMSQDYDIRPGGSLKLKGGVAEGGIVKK